MLDPKILQRFQDIANLKLTREQFVEELPENLRNDPVAILRLIESARTERSNEELRLTLALGSMIGFAPGASILLADLLVEDWHTIHEDIVLDLQQLRDPRTVSAICSVAEKIFPHMEWDDNFAFNRKCTWALFKIGTPEAFACLERLAHSENPKIAAFAQERLNDPRRD